MLSIVIPVYNEKEGLKKTISDIKSNVDFDCEIIVVDDASTDGSTAGIEGIKIIRNEKNLGYGASIVRGVQNAKYDWILIMDADASYPARYIKELFSRRGIKKVVVGNRRVVRYESYGALKRIVRFLGNLFIFFLTGRFFKDINSGMRVFNKNDFDFSILSKKFSFSTTMTLYSHCSGYEIEYVDIEYLNRVGNSKVKFFRDSITTLLSSIRTVFLISNLKYILPLFIISIIPRLYGLTYGFPYVFTYGDDQHHVLSSLKMGSSPLEWDDFKYPRFFHIFLLFFYGLYYIAGVILGFWNSKYEFAGFAVFNLHVFHLIGRITVAITGAVASCLFFKLARKFFNPSISFFLTLWFIFDGELVALSHQIKPDVLIHLLSIFVLIKLFNYIDGRSNANLYVASIAIGVMLSSQYITLPAVFLPLFVIALRKFDLRDVIISYLIISITFILINFQILFNFSYFLESIDELRFIAKNYGNFKEYGFLSHIKYNLYINDLLPLTGIFVAGGVFIAFLSKKITKYTSTILFYYFITIFIQGFSERSMLVGKYSLFGTIPSWIFIGYVLELNKLRLLYLPAFFVHIIYPYLFLINITGVDSRETARRYIEENLSGTFLIDTVNYSPNLKLCRDDIKSIYENLEKSKNKWSFFRKLQYDFFEADRRRCFKVYLLKREPYQTLDLPGRVMKAYENWLTVEPDIEKIKALKINYFIYSSYNQYQPGRLKDFYNWIIRNGRLVKVFKDRGPEIRIYKISD